ncbi:MAG: hemerythrin domain-containing protein [Chloroflexota bacterium]|nr:hemerythrin domain-containing protein [Chloroflexota bacterium]
MERLDIISRILKDHTVLKEHIKLAGDSMSDQEAIATLVSVSAEWIPGIPKELDTVRDKLQQVLGYLCDGLKNHFLFEEQLLWLVLGELFMKALASEHREIIEEIDKIKSHVADMKLEGLTRDELLSEESQVKQTIDVLGQLIDRHVAREEIILEMVKKSLEEEP